jgi:hypothetical protein
LPRLTTSASPLRCGELSHSSREMCGKANNGYFS